MGRIYLGQTDKPWRHRQPTTMPSRNTPWLAGAAVALAGLCLGGGIWLGRQQVGGAVTPSGPAASRQALLLQLGSLEQLQQRGEADAAQQQRLLELLVALERRQQAITLLEQLADQQPERWGLRLLLAELRRTEGDRSGATREVRQLLHKRPDQIEALQLYSLLLLDQGQGRDALQRVQASYARQSQGQPRGEALATGLLLAELLQRQGTPGQAEALLIKLAAGFPGDPRPLLARALVQQQRGDLKAAQNSLAQARNLRPSQSDPRLDQVASAWGLAAHRAPSRTGPATPRQAPSGLNTP
jgi:Flp pilus assembly protein TadD